MKDLAIIHTTNRSVLESLENLGSPFTRRRFLMTDARYTGQTEFSLNGSASPATIRVMRDGVELKKTLNLVPATGEYLYVQGGAPGGLDQIVIGAAAIRELMVDFSTFAQADLTEFELVGKLMKRTSKIFVGGEDLVTEFRVLSDTKIRFFVKTIFSARVVLEEVSAVSFADGVTSGGTVVFDISTRSKTARGLQMLIQQFMTLLMDPQVGNLDALIPKSVPVGPRLNSMMISRVGLAVSLTQAKMSSAIPRNADPSEILASATLQSIRFPDNSTAEAVIRILSRAGTAASLPLALRT